MSNKDLRDRFEYRARIMKALGHSSRLFIVHELRHSECSVHELTSMIGSDISTVSKHLSVLREAGIVDYRKEGARMLYFLAAPCVLDFFDCLERLVQTNLQRRSIAGLEHLKS